MPVFSSPPRRGCLRHRLSGSPDARVLRGRRGPARSRLRLRRLGGGSRGSARYTPRWVRAGPLLVTRGQAFGSLTAPHVSPNRLAAGADGIEHRDGSCSGRCTCSLRSRGWHGSLQGRQQTGTMFAWQVQNNARFYCEDNGLHPKVSCCGQKPIVYMNGFVFFS